MTEDKSFGNIYLHKKKMNQSIIWGGKGKARVN